MLITVKVVIDVVFNGGCSSIVIFVVVCSVSIVVIVDNIVAANVVNVCRVSIVDVFDVVVVVVIVFDGCCTPQTQSQV